MPKIYIIAGPNGAGKTTFAAEFLPKYTGCDNFVNADLIALGLSPFAPATVQIKAGKLLLGQIHQFIERNVDFAFESTLSGKTYLSLLRNAKDRGYHLVIFYLSLPNQVLAKERVRQRVREGGHNVSSDDINRRFSRSWRNFNELYKPLCDSWVLFDNSGLRPAEIAVNDFGKLRVVNRHLYDLITGETND